MFLFKNIIRLMMTILSVSAILLCGCENAEINKVPVHRAEWHINQLYEPTKGNKKIKVAVIDAGVNFEHPDLVLQGEQEVIEGLDLANNSDVKHGTAVVGIIGAYPFNDKGALGINPNVSIYSVDIMDDNEKIGVHGLTSAIEMAVEHDVDIINISAGVISDNGELHKVVKNAYNKGIVIVAAAGNDNNEDILYPAAYEEVLSVGCIDKENNILYNKDRQCDVYAPGVNIVTLLTERKGNNEMNHDYISLDGTSVSAPIVSGVISKVLEKDSDLKNEEIYKSMKELKYINSIKEVYEKFELPFTD